MPESKRPPRLGVVVPARDEDARLAACLHALDAAAARVGSALDVVVVLDGCTDRSEHVARATAAGLESRLHLLAIDARRVGTARRLGVERLLEVLGPAADWLSTTDADSVVPADWFERQLAYLDAGADLVVGTVAVADWEGRPRLRAEWERAYSAARHRHVHGANLGFRAAAYRSAGGFDDVTHDEDVRLVKAFTAAGAAVVWATDLAVATSARHDGRAPHGFSTHLSALSVRSDSGPSMEAL